MLLQLAGITKTYPGVVAIDGVSLDLVSGEVHAVLGENGAGKSTLMGIAAGSVRPDKGSVTIGGQNQDHLTPALARKQGVAIVYQTPALAPSLTVAEALAFVMPRELRPRPGAAKSWAKQQLNYYGVDIDPARGVESLSLREAHLVEIVSALIPEPSVLILDEPTEALGPDETKWLFSQIDRVRSRSGAVLYITHRIPEVKAIADRLTILRSGRAVGTHNASSLTDDEIVDLIIGRHVESAFPEKRSSASGSSVLSVRDLEGPGFHSATFSVKPGEILGLAGIEGHGQREVLRALAGLNPSAGEYVLDGVLVKKRDPVHVAERGIVYLSGDRAEGIFADLGVRENLCVLSLENLALAGFIRPGSERRVASELAESLDIRSASLESELATLSGGNQQKVLVGRAFASDARVLLVEDPTHGVDAGARIEIYKALRRLADQGSAVIALSTDSVELRGLCDRVIVFSSGAPIAELQGDQVTEEAITGSLVRAERKHTPEDHVREGAKAVSLGRDIRILISLVVALAAVTAVTDLQNGAFLSIGTFTQLLFVASALIFASLGQLLVVLVRGIDLSVATTMVLSGVVLSFFVEGPMGLVTWVGVLVALTVAACIGAVNVGLVTLGIPPMVATLVTATGGGGVALMLRPQPAGFADATVLEAIGSTIAFVPVTAILVFLLMLVFQWMLYRSRLGINLRAVGSDAVKAHRMGTPVTRTLVFAYVAGALLAGLGGICLYGQTGVGTASPQFAFTLLSVTAVVLGGANIFGGRGSFVAVAAAALLLQTITTALNFWDLDVAWQYWIPGALVLLAGAAYGNRPPAGRVGRGVP